MTIKALTEHVAELIVWLHDDLDEIEQAIAEGHEIRGIKLADHPRIVLESEDGNSWVASLKTLRDLTAVTNRLPVLDEGGDND